MIEHFSDHWKMRGGIKYHHVRNLPNPGKTNNNLKAKAFITLLYPTPSLLLYNIKNGLYSKSV